MSTNSFSETLHPLPEAEAAIEQAVLAEIHAMFGAGGDMRETYDNFIARTPIDPLVTLAAVDEDGVSGWWVRPRGAPADRALLYVHGGAFMMGSATAYRGFAAQIALRAGVAVFVADYPLAPEQPFPAAPAAVARVRHWLGGQGIAQLAVAGDSAGGALALGLLGDAGAPAIAAVAVFSPWLDLAMTGASFTDPATHDPVFVREMLAGPAAAYLAGADPTDGRASPLYAVPARLPPLLIQVGADELLLDDSRRYARAAAAKGGVVRLEIYAGLHHVFQNATVALPSARRALDEVAAFLNRHWIVMDKG